MGHPIYANSLEKKINGNIEPSKNGVSSELLCSTSALSDVPFKSVKKGVRCRRVVLQANGSKSVSICRSSARLLSIEWQSGLQNGIVAHPKFISELNTNANGIFN